MDHSRLNELLQSRRGVKNHMYNSLGDRAERNGRPVLWVDQRSTLF